MIAKLCGKVAGICGNVVIIDIESNNCSVGYEVNCKSSDISYLKIGENTTFYIKEIIKEDDDSLYGFLSFGDKCLFEELIKLSGLGAKIALSILSSYSFDSIEEAILSNNCEFFSSISGIGSKLANRIPNEMKKSIEKIREKVLSFGEFGGVSIINHNKNEDNNKEATLLNVDIDSCSSDKKTKNINLKNVKKATKQENKQEKANKNEIINDAVNALVALGFSRQNIYNDVFLIVKNNDKITTEEIVKEFLKKLDK